MISAFTDRSVNDLMSGQPSSLSLRGLRLLLRHAMQRAESPDQIAGINRHDFARREKLGESVERNAIIWIVEHRHEHQAIRDIKIGVAGGRAEAFKDDRARQRDFDDVKSLTMLIACGAEASEIVMQSGIIYVRVVRLNHRDDRVGRYETGDIVDVAVGVISLDAVAEPDARLDPEIIGKH